jgi:hypothetical protein
MIPHKSFSSDTVIALPKTNSGMFFYQELKLAYNFSIRL